MSAPTREPTVPVAQVGDRLLVEVAENGFSVSVLRAPNDYEGRFVFPANSSALAEHIRSWSGCPAALDSAAGVDMSPVPGKDGRSLLIDLNLHGGFLRVWARFNDPNDLNRVFHLTPSDARRLAAQLLFLANRP